MSKPRLVVCSGLELPKADPLRKGRHVVELDTLDRDGNTHLRIENLTKVFERNMPPRVVDLLEIAAYVYTADCGATRDGAWTNEDGTEPWGRDFHFLVPVRDPQFWRREDVQTSLVSALRFMSSDEVGFTFVRLLKDRPLQRYLDELRHAELSPFQCVERVVMFSGGIDSLAGAVEVAAAGQPLVAVSHRPMSHTSKLQADLIQHLGELFPGPMMHVPVWVNKQGWDKEPTQRTRSFLFSALGVAVGSVLNAGGVRLYENGVTSLNWPVAQEVLQSRASRVTHPLALYRMQEFYRLLTERTDFAVDNPYIFDTKSDVIARIANHGAADLLGRTVSCLRTIFRPSAQRHCGMCRQCIDRRIAVLASGQEAHDRQESYQSDVFTGPRQGTYNHNIAADYARLAGDLARMDEVEIAARYNRELTLAVRCFDRQGEAAQQFIEMHKRHAKAVCGVLAEQIAVRSDDLVAARVDRSSLLAMVAGQEHFGKAAELPRTGVAAPPVVGPSPAGQYVFRQKGEHWETVYEGEDGALIDNRRGMPVIAYLLSHPHHEYDPLELKRLVDGAPVEPGGSRADATDGDDEPAPADDFAGEELMDDEYRDDVKKLIREADRAVAEAERGGDPERLRLAKAERQKLFEVTTGELNYRPGPVRRFRTDSDRADDALSRRVKRALVAIQQSAPTLHSHLLSFLTFRTVFAYKPDRDIVWLTE